MALRLLKACRSSSVIQKTSAAYYHDYVRISAPNGTLLIGIATSRGNRSHQEDYYAFATLSLDPEELRISVKQSHERDWDPKSVGDVLARQAVFVGIYDGHGGSAVSQYLRQELHGLFESVNKASIPELFAWIKELGGYFKRFRGGALSPWIHENSSQILNLEARATLAFFEVDRNLSSDEIAQSCGATASVAIFHSLDSPATPFFSADSLALTVAHCGDTRVLLCATHGGQVFAMTENHHADARIESTRLRRMMGSSLITDSFGESRLGDLRYKKFGVTPEPEVRTKLLKGSEWSFVVLISDGISSILSDEEIVDLARDAADPRTAAERILSFSQELGGDDNATAIVVPLLGWGNVNGPDKTKELRDYRRRQAGSYFHPHYHMFL
ncbi:phosphatase 2C-like domain-containing protein [Infundibulicybe gibba]|nr:phosphatase 2C-like domain-containing protein [Infundibulicybe gibba]